MRDLRRYTVAELHELFLAAAAVFAGFPVEALAVNNDKRIQLAARAEVEFPQGKIL